MDTGSPVSNTYKPPFAFTRTIEEVRIELKCPSPRNTSIADFDGTIGTSMIEYLKNW